MDFYINRALGRITRTQSNKTELLPNITTEGQARALAHLLSYEYID